PHRGLPCMKHRKTTLVLPGDHLGDLPQGIDPAVAANFLACWTALWHPALLAGLRAIPATISPGELMARGREEGELLVVPRLSQHAELDRWCQSQADQHPNSLLLLDNTTSRAEVIP